MFDRADAIELVDITPDDLIQRLREGKVYVPHQAERALQHFFSPENLTALRELALRRTAERVDEQLLSQMQARAIPGPWAAGERILVCVNEDPALRRPRALRQAPVRPAARAVRRARGRDRAHARGSPRRSATASPIRCAWHRRSAAKPPPSPAATGASPTTSSAMPRRTTSPRSSSASRRVRAGSRSCTARWSTTSSAAPATSASTSSPANGLPATRSRRRR